MENVKSIFLVLHTLAHCTYTMVIGKIYWRGNKTFIRETSERFPSQGGNFVFTALNKNSPLRTALPSNQGLPLALLANTGRDSEHHLHRYLGGFFNPLISCLHWSCPHCLLNYHSWVKGEVCVRAANPSWHMRIWEFQLPLKKRKRKFPSMNDTC